MTLLALGLAACTSSGGETGTDPADSADTGSESLDPDSGDSGDTGAGDTADTGPGDTGDSAEPDTGLHVLVLELDGLHERDLARYLMEHPDSALAGLAATGVRYTHVTSAEPSDSFPGVLATFTGGGPASTGVYYDLSYDRTLSPPGSDCSTTGTTVDFTKDADVNSKQADGGGGLDPAKLPRDPARGCAVVMPHDYLRVNTVFEAVKAATGARTAWSDKHLSYEILQGPSGAGVDDLYDPEIGAIAKGLAAAEAYDDGKVTAVDAELRGLDHGGTRHVGVPAVLGLDFQAISVEQKAVGYLDADATPSPDLAAALDHTDASIARLVDRLHTEGLWDRTTVVVVAPHGNSPIDPDAVRLVGESVLPGFVEIVQNGLLAQLTGDDVALVWLHDATQTDAVAARFLANPLTGGVASVLDDADLAARFPSPATDARTPDLIALPTPGVIYSDSAKVAEHGGFAPDDVEVALLVAAPGVAGAVVDDPVTTAQVAPTILARLGLDPNALDAVRAEGTAVLPGLDP